MTIEEALDTINGYCSDLPIHNSENLCFEKCAHGIKNNLFENLGLPGLKEFYSIKEFIEAAEETKNVEIVKEVRGRLRTKNYTFQIIKGKNQNSIIQNLSFYPDKIQADFTGGIISLEPYPFIHAVATLKEKLTKKSDPLFEYESVVQVKFVAGPNRKEIEDNIINSFLFELENSFGLKIKIDDFNFPPPSNLSFDFIDDPDYSIATSRIKKIADLISSTKLKLYDEEALRACLNFTLRPTGGKYYSALRCSSVT